MKRMLIFVVAAALAAGCQAPKSNAPMPPTAILTPSSAPKADPELTKQISATQVSLQQRHDELKKTMRDVQKSVDTAEKSQAQIQSKIESSRNDLFETTKAIKTIKDRIDGLLAQQLANTMTVSQLQDKLTALDLEMKQIESRLSGTPSQIADLQKELDKERQQRASAAELEQQRQKEIADLRKTLDSQAQLLKESKKTVVADKTQPPVQAEPSGAGAHEDATKWVAQANNLLALGKVEDAEPLFAAAVKARPAMVSALVGLAACAYQRGDTLAAAKTADRVLDIDSKNAQALGIKGLVYRKEGSFSAASAALADAVKYDPNDARLRNYYGIALSDRKRAAESIEQFRKAIEIDPIYAEAFFNLASMLAMSTPPALNEARVNYDKAVSLGSERDADLEKLLGTAKGGSK